MDLFGKRRIAELEHANADLMQRLDRCDTTAAEAIREAQAAKNQVEYLVRTIRDMDQEIWNMGQKTDWNAQRSHFLKLHDEMTARKIEESKRIGSLIHGEIISTYSEPKQRRLK